MDRHTAKPGEYVAIEYKDGNIEHRPGPFSLYNNPVRHTAVQVRQALQLATPTDCVVVIAANSSSNGSIAPRASRGPRKTDHPVYVGAAAATAPRCQKRQTGLEDEDDAFLMTENPMRVANRPALPQVNRRVVCGPHNFIPNVNETVVSNSWMMDPAAPMRPTPFSAKDADMQVPVVFDIISTRPFRFPATVPLTTASGLTLTVDFDFGLRIAEVELAIAGGDPIAAVWLALQADLAREGQKLAAKYLETLDPSQSFARLGETYKGMSAKAAAVGLEVLDVQVKRVSMPAELKRGQDAVIAANTKHQAEMDATKRAAQVQQAAAEAKLQRAAQDEQIATAEFDAASRKEQHQHQLNAARQAHELELDAKRQDAQLTATKQGHGLLADFLGQLKAVDVDLTAYLTSMAPAPAGSSCAAADPRRQVANAAGLDSNMPSASSAAANAAPISRQRPPQTSNCN